MKKTLLLSSIATIIGLSAISLSSMQSTAEVNFKIDRVTFTSNETNDTIEFAVYLERPDLDLKQDFDDSRASGLSIDLSKDLQPKLMYLSTVDDTDPDTGSFCDLQRFPHVCTLIIQGDAMGKTSHELLLKITFEDDNNSYVAKKIIIPHPISLNKPEIVAPTTTPAQNSTLSLKFKDVGAMSYEVVVESCNFYNYDGINPCLDGVNYTLKRSTTNDPLLFAQEYFSNPSVKIENGEIIVTSDFKFTFEESVNYQITASTSRIGEDGIKYTVKNSSNKYLEK